MALQGFDHQVRWNEFTRRSSRPSGVQEDAWIETSNNFRPSPARRNDIFIIRSITADLKVDRNNSWVVDGKQDAALLRHEQGHFDIHALGFREMYRRVLQVRAATRRGLRNQLVDIRDEIQRKIDEANIRYDNQTQHGLSVNLQRTWEAKIREAKQEENGKIDDLPS